MRGFANLGHGDENRADWLFGRAAVRASNACESKTEIGIGIAQSPLGHGAGHRFAYGAVLGKECLAYAEQVAFGFIRVGHKSAMKDFGGAGDVRETVREKPACAGFGRRNGEARGDKAVSDPLFDPLAFCGDEVFSERLENARFEGVEQLLGADEAEINFVWAGAVADFEVLVFGKLKTDHFLHGAFSETDHTVDAAILLRQVAQ